MRQTINCGIGLKCGIFRAAWSAPVIAAALVITSQISAQESVAVKMERLDSAIQRVQTQVEESQRELHELQQQLAALRQQAEAGIQLFRGIFAFRCCATSCGGRGDQGKTRCARCRAGRS